MSLHVSVVLLAIAAVPQPSDEEIRRRLKEVLARPEFSPGGENTFLRRIVEWLARAFGWLGGLHEAAPVLFWVLLVGCLVLLALLVVHITWTVRRVFFAAARSRADAQGQELRGRVAVQFRDESLRCAERGEFTEAIRCLFLSLVYRFDECGRVNFQQAYTNREYLGLFVDRPPVHSGLKVFVDTLDDCWYGPGATDRRQYEDCMTLYERLAIQEALIRL